MSRRFDDLELAHIHAGFETLLAEQPFAFVVIDPLSLTRNFVVDVLRRAQCDWVVEARDGAEGLREMARARQAGKQVLAICEANLPDVDGPTLAIKVTQHPALSSCKIILMGKEVRREKVVAAIKAGASGFLLKPFDGPALLDKLSELGLKPVTWEVYKRPARVLTPAE